MKLTRICVGLAVWILLMATFLQLGVFGLIAGVSANMDGEFLSMVSNYLAKFSPVGWWSYLTPAAISVAIAAALRNSIPGWWLVGIVAGSLMIGSIMGTLSWFLFVVMIAASENGLRSPPQPIPLPVLAANIALLGSSIGLAVWSVARMRKSN